MKFIFSKKKKNTAPSSVFKLEDVEEKNIASDSYEVIEHDELDKRGIAEPIYDILYSSPQPLNSVKVLKDKEKMEYLVLGKGIRKRIIA